jgi:peptidyl-prolyl cis-trans isomerase B (cyclophilin B)
MVTHFRKWWLLVGLAIAIVGVGCGRGSKGDAPTASIPPQAGANADSQAAGTGTSFADSVITETDNADQLPPPDRTLNGLSTGKLRADVQRLWDEITFVSPAGKKIAYSAVLVTEDGSLTLALLPDVAPSHVRNFIALARAGYYDGLLFEHVIQQEGDAGPDARLELVEAGCPLGTGEVGIGHLGYWLRPEFSETVKHEEGTVGACRADDPDTAGCRFYITLSKAPVMDGNFTVFGRVTSGLDVVRKIAQRPRPEGSIRPTTPAVIRKVTIQTWEVDG